MQLKTLLNHYEGKAVIAVGEGRLDAAYIGYIHCVSSAGFYTSADDYDDDAEEAEIAYKLVEKTLSCKVFEFYVNVHGDLYVIVK